MKITEFKNGNLNIKFEKEDFTEMEKESNLVILLWALEWKDTYLIGDDFCLSNYDMGCMLYNCRRDLVYILSFSKLDEITKSGLTMKLYARIPDKWDRENIEKEMGA